jgi:hypothetical protein
MDNCDKHQNEIRAKGKRMRGKKAHPQTKQAPSACGVHDIPS